MAGTPPDAATLPLFQWRNQSGNLVDLDSGVDPLPRRITEYRVDPDTWADWEIETTPTGILRTIARRTRCRVCRGRATPAATRPGETTCPGEACVDTFRRTISTPAEAMVEIRDAGAMGKGIFAVVPLPRGTPLGEYLGELRPPATTDSDDFYVFEIPNKADCTSRQFGNWTRFMNHRCRPNVSVRAGMYGHRRAIMFRARADIAAGEQLFISYGTDYFRDRGISCLCSSRDGPHEPQSDDESPDDDNWIDGPGQQTSAGNAPGRARGKTQGAKVSGKQQAGTSAALAPWMAAGDEAEHIQVIDPMTRSLRPFPRVPGPVESAVKRHCIAGPPVSGPRVSNAPVTWSDCGRVSDPSMLASPGIWPCLSTTCDDVAVMPATCPSCSCQEALPMPVSCSCQSSKITGPELPRAVSRVSSQTLQGRRKVSKAWAATRSEPKSKTSSGIKKSYRK